MMFSPQTLSCFPSVLSCLTLRLGALTSSRDGGIGRYTLPPHTTKRRTTTNLKTKNNQNCQKNKLYGSPITKELKKKYSFRLVVGVETGSRGWEDVWQGNDWQARWSHVCVWINREEQLGSKTDWVPEQEKKASKHLAVRICGGCSSRRNSQPHRRIHWREPQDPRMYISPPTAESAPEGPNLLVGSSGSD